MESQENGGGAQDLLKICSRSSLLVRKTIAHAGDGDDEAGMNGVWFDFTAELPDIDMEVVCIGSVAWTPYLGEQHLACHDFAFVLDQDFEQVVLSRSQLDFLPVDGD